MIDSPDVCFVVDTTASIHSSISVLGRSCSCLYHRIPGFTLGEEKEPLLPSAGQDLKLCFNCGSPDHAVAACPEPIDREVVSLSRQLFNFLHPDRTAQGTTRFYVAEGWRQQRLEWLGSYVPGVIRGSLLRDALGLQEGDPGNMVEWLHHMTHWGYPPGWFSSRDPRQLICSRILDDEAEERATTSEVELFTVFQGTGDDEEIDLRSSSISSLAVSSAFVDVAPTRWATYPNTYFSSTALSIYNGAPLGKVASSPSGASTTFTAERKALWERILSGGLDTDSTPSVPPWRLPGVFGASAVEGGVKAFTPLPPSTTPPPLPPATNSPFTQPIYPVLNKVSTPSSIFEGIDVIDDGSTVDMVMSDNSE